MTQPAARPAVVFVYNAWMHAVLLVDGENFKGKIKQVFKDAGRSRASWRQYDFCGLLDKLFAGMTFDKQIFYFAKLSEYAESQEKSQQPGN